MQTTSLDSATIAPVTQHPPEPRKTFEAGKPTTITRPLSDAVAMSVNELSSKPQQAPIIAYKTMKKVSVLRKDTDPTESAVVGAKAKGRVMGFKCTEKDFCK